MRRRQIEAYLRAVSPPTVVRALDELLLAVRSRSPEALKLYLAVVDVLETADWPSETIEDWRVAAMAEGASEVAYLLVDPAPERNPTENDEFRSHQELEEVTLGEKKARARRASTADLDKFSGETHPHVLEILLNHPRVDERYVVRIFSRRPQRVEVITSIFRAPRWLVGKEVRRAIANNPYAPPRLVLRLLPLLSRNDLEDIVRGLELHPLVRQYASALAALIDHAGSRTFLDSDAADADATL